MMQLIAADIDRAEREENLHTLGLGIHWPARALVCPNRAIRVHPHNQGIPEPSGLLKVTDMTGMQEVEHAVREDHAPSQGTDLPRERDGISESY